MRSLPPMTLLAMFLATAVAFGSAGCENEQVGGGLTQEQATAALRSMQEDEEKNGGQDMLVVGDEATATMDRAADGTPRITECSAKQLQLAQEHMKGKRPKAQLTKCHATGDHVIYEFK